MNGYELSRAWFDFCFESEEDIKPTHTALYFFAIEHCNRLGWKKQFGFPSQMAMEAIRVKNWRTYINALNDLVEWGFIEMIEKSKNQYTSNVVAIVENTKAKAKALDKAMNCHSKKYNGTYSSTYSSIANGIYNGIDSINKPLNQEPLNLKTINKEDVFFENENNEENENDSIVDFSKMGFIGKARFVWMKNYPKYVWKNFDNKLLESIESNIKTYIRQKKKIEGYTEFHANKDDVDGVFEYLITHPPPFWDKRMTITNLDKQIDLFFTHAENPETKSGKNIFSEKKEEWREFFDEELNK